MAFLDFIKNRQSEQQTPLQETKPEHAKPATAREMYAQQDAQEKANRTELTPDVKSKADEVMQAVNQASLSAQTQSPSSPSEGGGSSTPMRQAEMNQDKTAPALSPTTEQVGRPANEPNHNQPTPDDIVHQERSQKTQESARDQAQRSQSQERSRGGWER
jgi:hypothetical protein